MNPTIEATELECVPESARVRHYDELERDAKAALPGIVENGNTDLPPETANGFDDGEVVRFTSYYRITVSE